MAEALPQIVWITDASGVIEYYSRRWFEYSGASPDSSDPKHWRGFVHPEDLERLISSWRDAAALGQPWQAEYRLRRADGSYRWHLGQAVPVTDSDGRVMRWFGSATDIDGQKCVEAELSRTAAERARLLQQKDILLLEIQHRVRNNLQLISSLLSLQNRTITDPETLQQFIEARGRIQTVAQVHEQLYLTDEPDRMDFAALLREMCLNQSKPGIEVTCRRDGPLDLPIDEATPLALIANELISNAVEYAYPADGGLRVGGGEVRVILEGRSPGEVELRVEDDGIGLPPDLERHQASLGMRLVRQLARQLRGEYRNELGRRRDARERPLRQPSGAGTRSVRWPARTVARPSGYQGNHFGRPLDRGRFGPAQQFQLARFMLHQGRAVIDPVTVVIIENAVQRLVLRIVDVAADDAIDAAPPRFLDQGVFIVGDELAPVLDLVLQVTRERPVGIAQLQPAPVEPLVDQLGCRVGMGSQSDRARAPAPPRCRTGRRG